MRKDIAREFIFSDLDFHWTSEEEKVLRKIFTNTRGRVFFIYNTLPANMITVLFAIYSRLKNARGIRGVFVDNFLPQVLASFFHNDAVKFLKDNNIKTLDEFINYSEETKKVYQEYLDKIKFDVPYFENMAGAEKMRKFLETRLDLYGHNSIARPAMFYVCFEQISILAAKSIEWTRPGAGYIELSTRYVDMSGKDVYPIQNELEEYGVDPEVIQKVIDESFTAYRYLQGENMNGPFPEFLRKTYSDKFADDESNIKQGVIGETCDVLGNLLPASTLTSLGAGLSGEALVELIKHLTLDGTNENMALIEMLKQEATKVGASQFVKFLEISEWRKMDWQYLEVKNKEQASLPDLAEVNKILLLSFQNKLGFVEVNSMLEIVEKIKSFKKTNFDKLFCEFEKISAGFVSVITYRSWRDLQRMGFCTHHRSFITPKIGFYQYDKPTPLELQEAFDKIYELNKKLYSEMSEKNVPDNLKEYPMALGNLITFAMSANLRQWEFVNWQRSKPTVNHEVRQSILKFEKLFRNKYPWWQEISRADMTQKYIFARGNKFVEL